MCIRDSALTREKMQSLVLKIWKETGKTIILITHSVEEALLLGERLYVMAPRPGRIHKEYNLPFASMGLKQDLILMDEPLRALDALTREKMHSLVLNIWKETGKTIILITHSVEEALLLGERLYVMAPRPGRIHKEYKLPFAEMGLKEDLREIKKDKEFSSKREEILSMIWNMEEEIMGKEN